MPFASKKKLSTAEKPAGSSFYRCALA